VGAETDIARGPGAELLLVVVVAGPNRNETFDVSTSTSPPLDHEALAGRFQTCRYRIEAYTAQIVAETPRFVWQMTQIELARPQNSPLRRQRLVHLPRQRFLAFRAADRVPSISRGDGVQPP
jgi:hypothetical protein